MIRFWGFYYGGKDTGPVVEAFTVIHDKLAVPKTKLSKSRE